MPMFDSRIYTAFAILKPEIIQMYFQHFYEPLEFHAQLFACLFHCFTSQSTAMVIMGQSAPNHTFS